MAKTTTFASDMLDYALRGEIPPWHGATSLYVSLHTGDPGVDGVQTTKEVSYPGYARVETPTSAWSAATLETVQGIDDLASVVRNAIKVAFPKCTGQSSDVAKFFGLGLSANGDGYLMYTGAITEPFGFALNSTFEATPGSLYFVEI